MPAERELEGVTIVLDALGGGSDDPRLRIDDDFALLTAGYLYHMLARSGAKVVMTRSDDRPLEGIAQHDAGAVRALMHQYHANAGLMLAGKSTTSTWGCRFEVPAGDERQRTAGKVLCHKLSMPWSKAASVGPDDLPSPDEARSVYEEQPLCRATLAVPPPPEGRKVPPALAARRAAKDLYEGMYTYFRENSAAPRTTQSNEESTLYVRSIENRRELSTLARTIWPEGDLPREKLAWFCDMYGRLGITNRSLVYFKPDAKLDGDAVVVRGATNVPAIADGLRQALVTVGFPNVRLEMETLPNADRLGGKNFGVCRIATAMTYGRPDERTVPQTQLLYGETVFLLDHQDGRYLLHAADGYWGWVGADAIEPLDAAAFKAYVSHPTAVVVQDQVIEKRRIPRGAEVAVESDKDGALKLIGAGGLSAPIARDALAFDPAAERAAAEARVRAALDLLYTPYIFGGRSPMGLDCSGLVASVWQRTGLPAARDASQQAFAGRLVATSSYRNGLRAGDVVFFINAAGKIYHTGVAIDQTHICDSSPPAVQIGCITSGDRLYDERMDRDFFIAKRP
jgi:hypothetical protein